MSFIRYKKFGNIEYAYEITAYWDRQQKKSRQNTKYLGIVVDKEAKIFKKKEKKQYEEEKLILDFGDTYILNEFMKKTKMRDMLYNVFEAKTEYLLALIYYPEFQGFKDYKNLYGYKTHTVVLRKKFAKKYCSLYMGYK